MVSKFDVILFVFLVMQLHVCLVKGEIQPGLRVSVAESTLQEINTVEIQAFHDELHGKTFDDVSGKDGDVEYRLSKGWGSGPPAPPSGSAHVKITIEFRGRIRITHLGSITADLDLSGANNAINWRGTLSSISIEADWWVRYKTNGWIPISISDDGDVDLDVGGTSVSISIIPSVSSGDLVITLGSCQTSVGGLDVNFHGGLLSSILDLLSRIFKDDMRSELEGVICDALEDSLSKVSEDMKTADTTFTATIQNLEVMIDNSFVDIVATDNSLVTYHKGSLSWNGKTMMPTLNPDPFPPSETFDISFDIRTDLATEFLTSAVTAGALDGAMTYFSENDENKKYFLLSCGDMDICIGKIIKEASILYPGRYVGLYWNVTSADVSSRSNEMTAVIGGRVYVNADNANASDVIFSGLFNVTVPVQFKLTGANIGARATGVQGSLIIDRSTVGTILTPEVSAIITILQKSMKSSILDHLNANPTNYEVKLPREISIEESQISIYPGFLRVGLNICYKRNCPCQCDEVWVGNSSISDISLEFSDIVPTTTTELPTTTSSGPTILPVSASTVISNNTQNSPGGHVSSCDNIRAMFSLTVCLVIVSLC